MSSPEQDPWDWSVDELVDALTGPSGLVKSKFPRSFIDLPKFGQILREHEMEGQHLLISVYEDKSCLKEDFGIKPVGQRQALLRVISDLQRASRQFQNWRAVESGSELAPIPIPSSRHSSRRDFSPTSIPNLNASLSGIPVKEDNVAAEGISNLLAADSKVRITLENEEKVSHSVEERLERSPTVQDAEGKLRQGENIVVDSAGQPRRRLQLAAPIIPASNVSEEGSALSRSQNHGSEMYLGSRAVPVDSLFYGPTELGHEISSEDPEESIEFDFVRADQGIGGGCSNYVFSRMKYFLLQNNAAQPRVFKKRRYHGFGLRPYPERLLKTGQAASVTVLSGAQYGAKPYRLNASVWKESTLQDLSSAFLPFNPSHLGSEDTDDQQNRPFLDEFSYLDKYIDVEEDVSELPAYGESGSEDGNDQIVDEPTDDDDEGDMAEEEADMNQQLTSSEVSEVIKTFKAKVEEQWTNEKLPRLEKTAFKLWHQARSQRILSSSESFEREKINRLDKRLADLEAGIRIVIWETSKDVQNQCNSLESTIEDLCKSRWSLSVLVQRHAPARPERAEKRLSKNPGPKPTNIGDERNGLNDLDDGLGDFIVDDLGSMPPMPLDDPMGDDPSQLQNSDTQMGNDDEQLPNSVEGEADIPPTTSAADAPDIPSPPHDDEAENNSENASSAGIDAHEMIEQLERDEGRPRRGIFELPQSSPLPPVASSEEENPQSGLSTNEKQPLSIDTDTNDASPSSPDSLVEPIKEEVDGSDTAHLGGGIFATSEIIDLTQLSDEEPENGLADIGPSSLNPHATPPKSPTASPKFMSSGQARPVFKIPPVTGTTPTTRSNPVGDIPLLPEGDSLDSVSSEFDVDIISCMSPEDLEERGDTRKILIFLLSQASEQRRKLAAAACDGRSADEISLTIRKGLRIMVGHGDKIRGEDPNTSAGLMDICHWFVCWVSCLVPSTKGLKKTHVYASISSIEASNDEFVEYYEFLHDRLVWHDEQDIKKNSKTIPLPFMKRKVEGDESSRSKKKRKVHHWESQYSKDQQNAANERSMGRSRRREEIRRMQQSSSNKEVQATKFISFGQHNDKDLIGLHPEIGERIQPHQVDGVQFMWSEVVTAEAGCLLAHPMGLGKTLQVITLLVTIAEAIKHPDENIREQIPESLRQSRTLILCPPFLADNWVDELLKWIPEQVSESIGEIRKVTSALKPPRDRLYEIGLWANEGGILILPYSLFRNFVFPIRNESEVLELSDEEEQSKVARQLLDLPNLVIIDEAQEAKNRSSKLFRAVSRIQTKCRVALTGSPLSNNLEEYYNLIDWVENGYLGELADFKHKYVEPISAGLYMDATTSEKRRGLKMLKVLTRVLRPKMDRADYSVLNTQLHGKTEFVIRVPLTVIQDQCYRLYVDHVLSSIRGVDEPQRATLWAWVAILGVLNNHPQAFYRRMYAKSSEQQKSERKGGDHSVEEASQELEEHPDKVLGNSMIQEQLEILEALPTLDDAALSHKMELVFEIIRGCNTANEKILVFSQSILTLDFIEGELKTIGERYYRIDGSSNPSSRQELTKTFNAEAEPAILLISTRAGGTGLNLHGASRVIIVDERFNPMHEEQAIGRAYRIGQKKHVYIYRLVIGGTFEETLNNQSLFKKGLANRVVDQKDTVRNAQKGVRQYIFPPEQQPQNDLAEFRGKDPKVLDRILDQQQASPNIRSIRLAESFMVEDEPLTAEEQRDADEMIEDEKLRFSDPEAYARKKEVQFRSLQASWNARPTFPNSTFENTGGPLIVPHSGSSGFLHPSAPEFRQQEQVPVGLGPSIPTTAAALASLIANPAAESLLIKENTTAQLQPVLGSGVRFNRPEALDGAVSVVSDDVEVQVVDKDTAPNTLPESSARSEALSNYDVLRKQTRDGLLQFLNCRLHSLLLKGSVDRLPSPAQTLRFVIDFDKATCENATQMSQSADFETTYKGIAMSFEAQSGDDGNFITNVIKPLLNREQADKNRAVHDLVLNRLPDPENIPIPRSTFGVDNRHPASTSTEKPDMNEADRARNGVLTTESATSSASNEGFPLTKRWSHMHEQRRRLSSWATSNTMDNASSNDAQATIGISTSNAGNEAAKKAPARIDDSNDSLQISGSLEPVATNSMPSTDNGLESNVEAGSIPDSTNHVQRNGSQKALPADPSHSFLPGSASQSQNLVDALSVPVILDEAVNDGNVGAIPASTTSFASYPPLQRLLEREKANARRNHPAREHF